MQEVDRWLDGLIEQVADEKMEVPELKRAIREKILESYRNGQQGEGQSPAPRTPAKSRSEQKQAGKPQRFSGDWRCSKCGAVITSLPFEPKGKSVDRLLCLDCYNAGRTESK
jgi:hypothetical protein